MMFKRTVYKMTFASSLMLLGTVQAQAKLDFLEPAKLTQAIKKEVAKQSIGANVNLVSADILDGVSAALKYRIQSEPSYVNGYYTRIDKYTFGVDINPGDIIEGLDVPVGFNINKNAEVIFARQFKSQAESLKAIPYTLKQLPLSAHTAIRELDPGDFVSLQTRLSFVVSLGASTPLATYLTLSGSTHAYVSGDFFIHVFKMPNNKIRVKLIGIHGNGGGANAQIGVGSGLKIFGFNYVDRKINKWLDLTPLAVGVNRAKSDLFMVDYVFDLNDSTAANAYEELMTQKTRFKDLSLLNPFESKQELKEQLLTDLSDVEEMSYADRNLPAQNRRVDRIFKGSNSSDTVSNSFRFGLNLLRFENGQAYAQNKIVEVDRNEQEKKYLLDTFSIVKKVKMFFGYFGDETTISTNLLFTSDNKWNPESFIALTMSREIKMKDVTKSDYREVQAHVRRILSEKEYSKIDWKQWDFSGGKRVNGFFKNEIVFRPEALSAMPELTPDSAYKLLKAYLEKSEQPAGTPKNMSMNYGEGMVHRNWVEAYDMDMYYLASYLSVVFGSQYSPQERYQKFLIMKDYSLWQERGAGFMLSLLPSHRLGELISYKMDFSAKGVESVSARFGNFNEEELYKSLMYIQNVINNRSFDLRLYTDANGEFTLRQKN